MALAKLRRFGFAGAPDRAARPQPAPAPTLERWPLYAELIAKTATGGRCVALDLAPASPSALAVFNRLRARLTIVDIQPVLAELGRATERAAIARRALGADAEHPATLALCWDFFNYLPREGIAALMQAVAERGQAGTRVHAIVAYSLPDMPEKPSRFTAWSESEIALRPGHENVCPSPRYAPKELTRCMPRFEIEKAVMLRNGFQEYIFRQTG